MLGATGEHFGVVPAKSLLVLPSKKCAPPQAQIVLPQKVTGPMPRVRISGLFPSNHCLCSPKVSKLFSRAKKSRSNQVNAMQQYDIFATKIFFVVFFCFLFFNPEFEGKNRVSHQKTRCATQAKEPPLARTVPWIKVTDPEPREGFAMKTFVFFLLFNSDFEDKITLCPFKNY